jgi:hypothetical protein
MVISITGKISGALVSGAVQGFRWPEATAIGLLLTTKGHLHIYLAVKVVCPYAFFFLDSLNMFFRTLTVPKYLCSILKALIVVVYNRSN